MTSQHLKTSAKGTHVRDTHNQTSSVVMNIKGIFISAINRIRTRKSAAHTEEHEAGRNAGREWAKHCACDYELAAIEHLAGTIGLRVIPDDDAGAWLATHMVEALGFNPRGPHAVYRACCVLFPDPDGMYSRDYVRGYFAGTADIWRERRSRSSPVG